jgi:hypothetical protein
MIPKISSQPHIQPHFGQAPSPAAPVGNTAAAGTAPVTKKSTGLLRWVLRQVKRPTVKKFACGTAGVLGATAAIYSVATDGMAKGVRDARQDQGGFYKKLFTNSSSSEHYSHLLEDVKGGTRQVLFDHWIFPAVSMVKHVTKSLAVSVVENIDTIAASAAAIGALFIKCKPARVVAGAAGAGYLLLKGGYTFMRDVLGFGKINT